MAKPPLEVQTRTTNDAFGMFAAASGWLGSKWAFAGAGLVIVTWAAVGPIFHFSDTWQLVINTGTTIVTFLMVFLIQNTQNRDARATTSCRENTKASRPHVSSGNPPTTRPKKICKTWSAVQRLLR